MQRNKKGVCLTSSGKQILPYVRKIVSDFEEIQQKVNEINGIQSGTVRIGTFSSVAINWLPDVKRLMKKGSVLISDNVLQEGDIIESH